MALIGDECAHGIADFGRKQHGFASPCLAVFALIQCLQGFNHHFLPLIFDARIVLAGDVKHGRGFGFNQFGIFRAAEPEVAKATNFSPRSAHSRYVNPPPFEYPLL